VVWWLYISNIDQAATSSRKAGIEPVEGVLGYEPASFNRRAGDVVLA